VGAMESELMRVTQKQTDPGEYQRNAVEASIAQMEAAGVAVPDTMKEALLSCCAADADDADLECATCKLGVNGDEYVACDECNLLHHPRCVMLLEVPECDWKCAK